MPFNARLSRMTSVQAPIIPIVGQWARKRPGTISLGQGIAFYPPPPGAIATLNAGLRELTSHQYHPVQGIPPLLAILRDKLAAENQTPVGNERAILVTAGGNMAFVNAVLAITQAGDEIILNVPYYFNHEMAIRMADCTPTCVATDDRYHLDVRAIASAITPKTRAVVTVSPNNPSGAVYSETSLRAVNQLCRDRGIYHISDEPYEYFTYAGRDHFSPNSIAQSHEHTIALYSLSKAYGFAGWRIGYMVVPRHLLDALHKIQDTILICPPVASQYAALGALKTGKSYCQSFLSLIGQVREMVLANLQSLGEICTFSAAEGAFYVLIRVNDDRPDLELVRQLIDDWGVAVLPGSAFGMTGGGYLRVAYGALQPGTASEGMERLARGLRAIAGV
jgi:aspartate/methionine/tyrosine aminotransferase